MARLPAASFTSEESASTTIDAMATTATSASAHPVAATMKREDEETIVSCKET
jgi:hypothetical protein